MGKSSVNKENPPCVENFASKAAFIEGFSIAEGFIVSQVHVPQFSTDFFQAEVR